LNKGAFFKFSNPDRSGEKQVTIQRAFLLVFEGATSLALCEPSLFHFLILPFTHTHTNAMLGKKIVFGAIATVLSFAASVAAESVIALTPKTFDQARFSPMPIAVFPLDQMSWTDLCITNFLT